MRRSPLAVLAAGLIALAGLGRAEACTSFRLKTTDGAVVYARTMEYAQDLHPGVTVAPKGTPFVGTLPDGSAKGLAFPAKYGFVGMNSFGTPVNIDGVNEKGLAAGGLLFPGYAGYQPFEPAEAGKTIAQFDVINWILSQFATVAEVRQGLAGVRVCQGPSSLAGVAIGPLPLHWTVHDAGGASIVIEYMGGTLKVHDNPLTVLTNSPDFDWMRIYLSNYVNLSAVNAAPKDLSGYKVDPTGQGSGMLGLPGDFTPPSRFLRMVALTQSASPVTGAAAGVNLAMTIINNVDIPLGAVRDVSPAGVERDVTQWVAVADTARGRYYLRTYTDKNWRSVDVKAALAKAGKTLMSIPMDTPADYPDITAAAKPMQ
ncbi:choloylglycine hydrolase family protein [Solidesulfovibrio sp.]|uniref:choloylglycine hydrolase family protein n=1 Tax=Solidesulfovibrio sp. TaxID=2910990 RepID=UPI002604A57A|nr:choloylglycine hydrolase family protein [Solidesulfovibrio sp.]